jgi:hypothetical protein
MSCTTIITSGIDKDCATINAAIGVEKDLILVNYVDFDKTKTFEPSNRESSGVAEVASLSISGSVTTAGNVTITLNGVATNIAVALSDTPTQVSTKIRAGVFTGWTTGGTGTTVTFTSNTIGTKTDAVYSEGTTGATGVMTTPIQGEDASSNAKGLKNIFLKFGAEQHVFEGTEFSVIPSIIPAVKDDGSGTWYDHQILFTVYSKRATDRKTIEALAGSRVIAIAVDRSTGLYELFGADLGLKVSTIVRPYTGAQNSNFYQVTLLTPEIDIVKESGLGELSALITTNLI